MNLNRYKRTPATFQLKIKKEHILLTSIIIIGIAARIIKFDDPGMVMDTVAFSRLGKNLIESGRYVFGENYNMGVFFPPGYPGLIGIVNLFINDLFFSAKLVSFIASCITILFSYLIGKELYNKEAGLFAALVYALYPVILIISIDAYADALFFCFLLISLYIFIVSLEKDPLYIYLLFGISVAAAFLTRPEGLFIFALPGLQLFGVFSDRISFNKKYILKFTLSLIVFVMLISPYMLFLKNYTGKFTLSGKSNVSLILGELSGDREYHDAVNAPDNLYDRAAFTLNEDKTQLVGWGRGINSSLRDYLLKNPLNLLSRYQKNVLREIKTLNKLLIPICLPLFFAFFSRELFRKKTRLIFIIFPFAFFLMYPLFLIIEKQTLLIVVFLIFFSSGGFVNSKSAFSDIVDYYGISKNKTLHFIEKNIKYIMILILIVSSLSYLKYSSFHSVREIEEHKMAGQHLYDKVSKEYEKLNVMGRKPYVSYYSHSKFTMLPYAKVEDVIGFAKLYKVDYIVIDELSLSKWDFYDELMNMHNNYENVELVYEDKAKFLIRLFKIN